MAAEEDLFTSFGGAGATPFFNVFIYFFTLLSCTGQGLMGNSLSLLCTAAWGCSEDACFPNVLIQTANN